MDIQLIAILILVPFAVVFIYAGIHEYRRYKSEGRARYGLVYDEETGTTHITGISKEEDRFDPDEFDPNEHKKRANETKTKTEDNKK